MMSAGSSRMYDGIRKTIGWVRRRSDIERTPQATMIREAERLAAIDEPANSAFLDRLETAIRVADERGDHDLASRGRRALEAIDPATVGNNQYQFHSARGTPIPGDGQSPDR